MEKQSFRNILVLISATVLLILGSQVYRTVENYNLNKQRFINDVQVALDLAVEQYYANKAKSDIIIMQLSEGDSLTVSSFNNMMDNAPSEKIDSMLRQDVVNRIDCVTTTGFSYAWSTGDNTDSLLRKDSNQFTVQVDSLLRKSRGSFITKMSEFKSSNRFLELSQQVMISLSEDLLDLGELFTLLKAELERKNLDLNFKLAYDGIQGNTAIGDVDSKFKLNTRSKSTYLPKGETLTISFNNESLLILKKGLLDILLSLAIVLTVVGALLYLYKIISRQKQLALIKDDLISNITHEFKTPIATISSAIEGIAHFNKENDPEKTKRYLGISSDQLGKLNTMVEKLLETAAIDSGDLQVDLQEMDVSALTSKVVENFKLIKGEKVITLSIPDEIVLAKVDEFHFENALSNLIDNALKYGGEEINVILSNASGRVKWEVIDNGGNIGKEDQKRIFEKLYRVPKGNQHDVKGFGIGLYYTKSIIEQHGGKISVAVKPGQTNFTIEL